MDCIQTRGSRRTLQADMALAVHCIIFPFEKAKEIFRQIDIGNRKVWDLRQDINEWCIINGIDLNSMQWSFRLTSYPREICFEDEQDAVQFKLRWS
jgi:hypothetical protein